MSNGDLTAKIADLLQLEFDRQKSEIDVLHDHRQQGSDSPGRIGKPHSWFGADPKPRRKTLLADLDIAVVSHHDHNVYALIEIEETTDKPKVILGDVFAALLGSGIVFQGKHDFKVGKDTTLIVMVFDKNRSHCERLKFLNEQIAILNENLTTPNAKIGKVLVNSFTDTADLEKKLKDLIREAVNQTGIQ